MSAEDPRVDQQITTGDGSDTVNKKDSGVNRVARWLNTTLNGDPDDDLRYTKRAIVANVVAWTTPLMLRTGVPSEIAFVPAWLAVAENTRFAIMQVCLVAELSIAKLRLRGERNSVNSNS